MLWFLLETVLKGLTWKVSLPDFDRLIFRAAGQAVAQLIEGHGPDGGLVGRQGGAANLKTVGHVLPRRSVRMDVPRLRGLWL